MPTVIDMNANITKPVFPIVETGAGEFVHQIPEPFHSGFIKGDGEANERTKSNLDGVARKLTDLNVSHVKLDPNHANNVNNGFREIDAAISESRNLLTTEAKRLVSSLEEKSGFKVDATMQSFVVGTFQGMRPEERAVAVAKLIEQRDGKALAILDSISGVFTGLGDEVKSTIRDRLFAKVDGQSFARLQDVQHNLARVEAASIASANACAKFSAPMHRPDMAAKEKHRSMIDPAPARTGFGVNG